MTITYTATTDPTSTNGAGAPDSEPTGPATIRSSAFVLDIHPDAEADVITNFYDAICYVGPAFDQAADAVDLWSVNLAAAAADEDRALGHRKDGSAGARAALAEQMHLYRPTSELSTTREVVAEILVHRILGSVIGDLYRLPPRERGHYLAQLATRWFSDGTLDLSRFRVAHMISAYVSMMPRAAQAMGSVDHLLTGWSGLPLYGWTTNNGDVYLDFCEVRHRDNTVFARYVREAIEVGNDTWPGRFRGLRYLPLEELDAAVLYDKDGGWEAFPERDLITAS